MPARVAIAAATTIAAIVYALIRRRQRRRLVLVARHPMPIVDACMDGTVLLDGERLVWFFRHGESLANAAGRLAMAADKARDDGLDTERVQHEVDMNFSDAALTETGIAQASARRADTASWRLRPEAIVTSPLTRALQTAAYIFADDLAAGTPLIVRPELREYFPNLAQDRGRPLAALRADPAIVALPNAAVILAALSDAACADWRDEWDSWQACGDGWERHCGSAERVGAFKEWLLHAHPRLRRVATVSHFGTVNAFVNHEPCIEVSGLVRMPPEKIGINAFAWRMGVLPPEGGVRVEMRNCGHVALVYSERTVEE